MIEQFGYFFAIIFFMICSAFFSGVEIAFVSVNKMRLRHLAEIGNPAAARVRSLLDLSEEVLTSILIGNNLCVIAATALFTLWAYPLGRTQAEWLSTFVMLPLVLIFAEIIPKVFFRHKANQLIFVLIGPLYLFFRIMRPIVDPLLGFIKRMMTSGLSKHTAVRSPFVSKEELYYLIEEGQKVGLLESHERRVIERIFELGVIAVREVMTRRSHVVSILEDATVAEAREIFRRTGFSRLPVQEKETGRFTGLLHVLDSLFEKEGRRVSEIKRPLVLVDEDTVVQKALVKLRIRKQRMALVRGTDGDIVGLVTVQDLIAV